MSASKIPVTNCSQEHGKRGAAETHTTSSLCFSRHSVLGVASPMEPQVRRPVEAHSPSCRIRRMAASSQEELHSSRASAAHQPGW